MWKTSHYYSQSPIASPRRTRIKLTAAVGYLTRSSCHRLFNGGNFFYCQAYQERGCLGRSGMEELYRTQMLELACIEESVMPKFVLW